MSETQQRHAGGTGAGEAPQAGPTEEQMRAYEAELNRITSAEIILQTAVSLVNIGGRRLGLGGASDADQPQRDLEQVADAIDGVRALMPILELRMQREIGPLRDALAQLQMAYAKEAKAEPEQPSARKPGPAQVSGRLWVPGQ